MTPDLIADQMIAAGCVTRLVASFFPSGSAGGLHEIRHRVEQHDRVALEVEEYSHYGKLCRYEAGASGLPFVPLCSYAGSNLQRKNCRIRLVDHPYDGGQVYVVPPLNPDVTTVHAQRADRSGNVQLSGITGAQQEAVYAAERAIVVVVVVEEVVDVDVVRADPSRTLIPAHAVDAVVHLPRGAHPSYAQGYYDRDGTFYRAWTAISKDSERLQLRRGDGVLVEEWVRGLRGAA